MLDMCGADYVKLRLLIVYLCIHSLYVYQFIFHHIYSSSETVTKKVFFDVVSTTNIIYDAHIAI